MSKKKNPTDTPESTTAPEAQEPAPSETTTPECAQPSADDTHKALLEQVDSLQEALQKAEERFLRAVADLDNFRKRSAREKEDLRKYAISAVVEDLLPALDNLKLGLASAENHAGQDAATVAKGFAMVGQQLLDAFRQHGLQEIDPAGEAFDPHFHDCVATQPHAEIAENHVMQVMRTGYVLNDRLLRPASVVVSSGPEASAPSGEPGTSEPTPAETDS